MGDEVRVPIVYDTDIVAARSEGRRMALELGFSRTDATLLATAISEVARNILIHAREGIITISSSLNDEIAEIVVVATDEGPGIQDVEMALRDGYSSSGGLGLGLPGVRRLMDEFRINSEDGKGTEVSMTMWRRQ
ncbi:MAG: ATP-binding protein [Actinobacteria bacterium]|nr:ATP-binding protein [Actinomycetota bacterium]